MLHYMTKTGPVMRHFVIERRIPCSDVGPVKLKSGKGEDLCMPKLTCHPLWTVGLNEDVEH